MKNKLFKYAELIGTILTIIGFILVIGTAGALEQDTISYLQFIIQLFLCITLTGTGIAICMVHEKFEGSGKFHA